MDRKVVVVYSKSANIFSVVPGQGIKPANVQVRGINRSHLEDAFYLLTVTEKPSLSYFLCNTNDTALAMSKIDTARAKELCSMADTPVEWEPAVTSKLADAPKEKIEKPATPKGLPPAGVFCESTTWRMLTSSLELGLTPFLMGPRGCGKSTVARALAESLGWKFTQFDMGQAFKPQSMFLGNMILNSEGHTDFITSEFYEAFTSEEPMLIFLDEITRCPIQAQNYLMTIIAPNTAYIYNSMTGERVNAGKNVRFIAAGNLGSEYSGAGNLDAAFSDRFVKFALDYLPSKDEVQLLQYTVENLTAADAAAIVKAATLLRNAAKSGTLSVGFSTRQAINAAKLAAAGWTIKDIIRTSVLNNYAETDEIDAANSILASV